jgi:hypothetical protein
MSRKGNCWDNAPTESLWGRLKVGRLYGQRFATRRQAMDEVIDWLTFYNHRRLHSPPLRDSIILTRDTLCDTIGLNTVVQRCESAS